VRQKEREALIEQLEELKRSGYDSIPDLDHMLDAEIRLRFGLMIYRAVATSNDIDLRESVFFFT
jgi:hypothetical protein